MPKKAPLLSLDTFEAQPLHIDIDGESYALIGRRDVGFRTWAHITNLNARVHAINTASEAEADAGLGVAEKAIDEMVSIIMPSLPKAKRAALNPWQKLAICEAFSEAVLPTANPMAVEATGTPLN